MEVATWIICNFFFKGSKYVQNFYICWFSYRFSEILKKVGGCFSHNEYLYIMSLVSSFWVIWGKVIKTHEAPDFLGLHKIQILQFL